MELRIKQNITLLFDQQMCFELNRNLPVEVGTVKPDSVSDDHVLRSDFLPSKARDVAL